MSIRHTRKRRTEKVLPQGMLLTCLCVFAMAGPRDLRACGCPRARSRAGQGTGRFEGTV